MESPACSEEEEPASFHEVKAAVPQCGNTLPPTLAKGHKHYLQNILKMSKVKVVTMHFCSNDYTGYVLGLSSIACILLGCCNDVMLHMRCSVVGCH